MELGIENLKREGYGLGNEKKNISMQKKMYKTNSLVGETYKELTVNNQALLNIKRN